MRFAITRASGPTWWSGDPEKFEPQPCAEAKLIDTPPEMSCLFEDPKIWVVDVETLEDLLAIMSEIRHPLVLRGSNWYRSQGIQAIQVYDDYIE